MAAEPELLYDEPPFMTSLIIAEEQTCYLDKVFPLPLQTMLKACLYAPASFR